MSPRTIIVKIPIEIVLQFDGSRDFNMSALAQSTEETVLDVIRRAESQLEDAGDLASGILVQRMGVGAPFTRFSPWKEDQT